MKTLIKRKGVAGLILILVISLVLTPLVSFAGQGDIDDGSWDQIGNYVEMSTGSAITNEGVNPYLHQDNGKEPDEDDYLFVDYSKTITGTGIENEFEITLDVKTNENIMEAIIPSNLIVVLDVTSSMGKGDGSKWDGCMTGIETLILNFLEANSQNKVALAAFGNTYSTNILKQATGVDKKFTNNKQEIEVFFDSDAMKDYDKAKQAFFGNTATGTNGEAAFRAMKELLLSSSDNGELPVYTTGILVSDGSFNRSYSGDSVTSSGNHKDKANAEANTIKGTASVQGAITNPEQLQLFGFAIATTAFNGITALDDTFNASESTTNIQKILSEMEYKIKQGVELWTLTDPMSQYVSYGGLVSGNENAISFNDETLKWDLTKEVHAPGADGIYTYSLTYKVSLNEEYHEDPNFYPTNDYTELTYGFKSIETVNGVEQQPVITDHAEGLMIPTVCGIPRVSFTVTKNVTGTTDTSQKFEFQVTVDQVAYDNQSYVLIDKNGQETAEKGKTDESGSLWLSAGQTAKFSKLVAGTKVMVKEIQVLPYSANKYTQVETINEGTHEFIFNNTYAEPTGTALKSSKPDTDKRVWRGEEITYSITLKNNETKEVNVEEDVAKEIEEEYDTGELNASGEAIMATRSAVVYEKEITGTESVPVTATGIIIKDYIPEFTKYVTDSVLASGGKYYSAGTDDRGYVAWYIDELAPGAEVTVEFKVIVTDDFTLEDEITNQALYEITGKDEPEDFSDDPNRETNEVVHQPPAPIMTITKSNDPTKDKFVTAGDTIEYFITITNTSDRVSLENLWVKDYIPAFTTFSKFTGYDYSLNGEKKGPVDKEYVQWLIAEVEAGDEIVLSFKVTVNQDVPDNYTIKNIASAEVLGADKEIPADKDPSNDSEPVYNYTGETLGEEAKDDKSSVKGEESFDDDQQSVLGEEAKTDDAMSSPQALLIMGGAALAVLLCTLWRMTRREE